MILSQEQNHLKAVVSLQNLNLSDIIDCELIFVNQSEFVNIDLFDIKLPILSEYATTH